MQIVGGAALIIFHYVSINQHHYGQHIRPTRYGNDENFTIKGKKGDVIVLDYSFCDFPMTSLTYNTQSCLTTDGVYTQAADYDTSFDYDRSTTNYTETSTGMTPKSGVKIAYAAYTINASGTVTVNWKKPSEVHIYNIKLDHNGGTNTGTDMIYEKYGYGFYIDKDAFVKIGSVDKVPHKDGYTFLGYYDTNAESGGTQCINKNGKIVVDNNFVKADTTWYARYEAIPIPDIGYTIEHYLPTINPATGAESYSTTPTKSQPYLGYDGKTVEIKDLICNDDSFAGYTFSNAKVNNATVTSISPTNGMIIKMYYTGNYYKVDLEKGSGIDSVSQSGVCKKVTDGITYYKYGTNVTVTAVTSAGYSFGNWETLVGDVAGSTNATYTFQMPASDVKMIANSGAAGSYIITYDLMGGVLTDGNPSKYTVNTETFTLNNPKKEHNTFTGWTGSNGTTPQTTVTITKGSTGNREYTANWSLNTYTVTLNNQGATTAGTTAVYEKYS